MQPGQTPHSQRDLFALLIHVNSACRSYITASWEGSRNREHALLDDVVRLELIRVEAEVKVLTLFAHQRIGNTILEKNVECGVTQALGAGVLNPAIRLGAAG